MNIKKFIFIFIITIIFISCSSNFYTVRRGDTLTEISKNSRVSVGRLKEINHLTNDKLAIGQKIYFTEASKINHSTSRSRGKNRIDSNGINLIKDFEKLSLKSYRDSGGTWTVGYGHTGPDVGRWTRVSKRKANRLLEEDVSATERAVADALRVKTTQNQFNAMVSLAFNVGVTNFKQSTLLRLHNKKAFSSASREFIKWSKVNGKTSQGLLIRRRREANIYKTKTNKYVN
jgi:lysozyme